MATPIAAAGAFSSVGAVILFAGHFVPALLLSYPVGLIALVIAGPTILAGSLVGAIVAAAIEGVPLSVVVTLALPSAAVATVALAGAIGFLAVLASSVLLIDMAASPPNTLWLAASGLAVGSVLLSALVVPLFAGLLASASLVAPRNGPEAAEEE